MVDAAANSNPGDVFVQGVSHVVDDVTKLTVVGSERASSSPGDVVVAIFVGEKGDGSVPSSTIKENLFITGPSTSFSQMNEISYVLSLAAYFANRPSFLERFSISSIRPSVTTLTLCFLNVVLRDLVMWISACTIFFVGV
ncbi:hypothetical protein Tco_0161712 [Tanacetum coccineum]